MIIRHKYVPRFEARKEPVTPEGLEAEWEVWDKLTGIPWAHGPTERMHNLSDHLNREQRPIPKNRVKP